MNILTTLDSNYLYPLRVMLTSLRLNNPKDEFQIYLIHSRLKPEEITDLSRFTEKISMTLNEVMISDHYFDDAKILMHYSKEMYYRLLAHKLLPDTLERVLYLDPDILILNPIKPLYETDLEGYLYAACCHKKMPTLLINQVRLNPYKIYAYYNSGVLLMNLKEIREKVNEEDIFNFVDKYYHRLLLPDQDVLNALYSKEIKKMDEIIYNYDARNFFYYMISTGGKCDMDYILNNTVVLHFCGKKKPWSKRYMSPFLSLYKHYEKMAKSFAE